MGKLVLNPAKDAMIRGGSYSDTSYESNPFIALKASPEESDIRNAVIQFNLTDADPNVDYLFALKLYIAYVADDNQRSVTVYQVMDDLDWSEQSITWNTFGSPSMEEITTFEVMRNYSVPTLKVNLGNLDPVSSKITLLLEITSDPSLGSDDGSLFQILSAENTQSPSRPPTLIGFASEAV